MCHAADLDSGNGLTVLPVGVRVVTIAELGMVVGRDFNGTGASSSTSALKTARRITHNARIMICHAFRVPFEGKLQIADASDETIRNDAIAFTP